MKKTKKVRKIGQNEASQEEKLREEVDKIVKYKTGKECYEHQAELINNECIILANKVKIKYEVTE